MKNAIRLLAGAAICTALTVQADPLLYWMVDQGDDPISFDVARVAYSTDGGQTVAGYLNLVDENGNTSQAIAASSGGDTAATWADINGLTGSQYSFFVELLSWNDSTSGWDRMGQSQAQTYDQLVSSGNIAPNALSIGTVTLDAWTGGGVTIPEPSGALLMLVGGSLLALRRRRKSE